MHFSCMNVKIKKFFLHRQDTCPRKNLTNSITDGLRPTKSCKSFPKMRRKMGYCRSGLFVTLWCLCNCQFLVECNVNVNHEPEQQTPERSTSHDSAVEAARIILENAMRDATELLSDKKVPLDDVIQSLWNAAASEHLMASYKEDTRENSNPPESIVDHRRQLFLADRHVERVNSTLYDPDCMSLELDFANEEEYDFDWIASILDKCRILVIRNVFDPDFVLNTFKPELSKYLHALKTADVDHEDKTLYSPEYPSKRYEIMLPYQLAMSELIKDERILELLQHPTLLGPKMFLHSLGTVVTEPGAPHQQWHEEDDYIFGTMDSMENFGIAGHDLPPYTINLFSPLLNLTYDHGPTEFCIGTSMTTGLLSGNWQLYNQSLQKDPETANFYRTLKFHQRTFSPAQLPCPTRNLRSTLLHVGDVVLFDYQIIHRAGHNRSPDTRAQLYMAYSRPWFRDFNYHVNFESDTVDPTDEDYGDLTEHTRFALGVSNDIFDNDGPHTTTVAAESEACQNGLGGEIEPIEQLREILPQSNGDDMTPQMVKFVISNVDIEVGMATLTVAQYAPQPLTPPGTHHVVHAPVGSTVLLHSMEGKLLKRWLVPFQISQLVVNRDIVGLQKRTS